MFEQNNDNDLLTEKRYREAKHSYKFCLAMAFIALVASHIFKEGELLILLLCASFVGAFVIFWLFSKPAKEEPPQEITEY